MKKKLSTWLIVSASVMLLFPWVAVTFAKGDAGMAICFLLFFAVNPLYSICVGFNAGKNLKKLWVSPMIVAALFLLGTWVFFDMGEPASSSQSNM